MKDDYYNNMKVVLYKLDLWDADEALIRVLMIHPVRFDFMFEAE